MLNAYHLLGFDWQETAKVWKKAGFKTPPVMISVANRTETAARIKHAFDRSKIHIEVLCDPDRTLHIDSKVLDEAESADEPITTAATEEDNGNGNGNGDSDPDEGTKPKLTKKQQAELLRLKVDTVGKLNQPGEQIQNVISVGMLSEGWDAKTVTHIMGLRAFTSQLLCEQVVGRGLRRTSYELDPKTGLFEPEYVNIFGVPFTFLPHESTEGAIAKPPKPKTAIEPDPTKATFEINWPNVIRIEHVYHPTLSLNWSQVKPLVLNASLTPKIAELAPIVEGKPNVSKIAHIDLERLAQEFRFQRIAFTAARDVFDQMQKDWKGSKEALLAQLVKLVEQFIKAGKITIAPALFNQDLLKRRLIITLNMTKVVQHIWDAIRFENTEHLEPLFDRDRPIRSTADVGTWYTGKPCERAKRSHINFCVYDSTWESTESYELDKNPAVAAWVKNDHLGFEILYVYRGVVRKYRPDFLIRLASGKYLVLETKGQDTEQDQVKRRFLDEWARAVNAHGAFGHWSWALSKNPSDLPDLLGRYKRAIAS